MPATNKPSPQAPTPKDRAQGEERFEQCDDERLSRNAGYGRADSTPKTSKP